jgi:hypothetical protein
MLTVTWGADVIDRPTALAVSDDELAGARSTGGVRPFFGMGAQSGRFLSSSSGADGRREVLWGGQERRGPVVDYLNVGLRDNANADSCDFRR